MGLLQTKHLQPSTCKVTDLDAGECIGDEVCYKCTSATIPVNGNRFPEGRLLCRGIGGGNQRFYTTCTVEDVDVDVMTFRNPADYMVCEVNDTCNEWNVENAGTACCTGNRVCSYSKIALTDAGGCQTDMCCNGFDACGGSVITGIESLHCQTNGGYDGSCGGAEVTLQRDLICAGGEVNCRRIKANFVSGGDHVVDCLGAEPRVCSLAELQFAASSKIAMTCTETACQEAEITMKGDSCIDLDCGSAGCQNMKINKEGTDLCYYQGNAANKPAECIQSNSTQCGPVKRDDICCLGSGGCADCCPSTTTSTTTAHKPYKPYGYSGFRRNRRENRRQNRRNRRQNRRNRRDYSYS